MKKVVILSNHHAYTYNFRKEIIEKLLSENIKVYLILPYGEKVELLKQMGCEFIDLPLDRRGKNPLTDLKLIISYFREIKKIKPDAVLSYTVKPNIYGGIVCNLLNIPFFPNVTGLGSAVENRGIMQKVLISMYKIAYKKAKCIFIQNEENKLFLENNKILSQKQKVIPGSGVNIHKFLLTDYPNSDIIEFVYISRIMKEKGIDNYLDAAKYIKNKYPQTRFHVLGFCEERYEDKLMEYENEGYIKYHGMQDDVRKFISTTHCTVHPSYYPEGMSNVLLESAATGRPIITTNRSGCKEIVDNGINGYLVEMNNSDDLIRSIEKFIQLPHEDKMKMGLNGRAKVVREFDRKIVVESYWEELRKV
ncbi:glycosyltransferase family 4 protein [Terribacillus sp. 7520-G]|uniref:glycosyltransferase family 4 protein n=1 Tax=Terribacillus sp. 7520-G TaxID=2025389 RepID=UPI000BA6B52E|nr:glycosyltransferase family 4 protein [Terribacillus sp. 7520-G]PAD40400.1 glycosyltransferase family 1 protein [Terribacillus sp. 7520-G]